MENEPETNPATETPDSPVTPGDGSNDATSTPATPDAPHTGTGDVAPSDLPADSLVVDPSVTPNPDEFQYVFPIEWRQHNAIISGDGMINIIHEITLGDLLISTLLLVLIVWQVVSRLVRR